MHEAALFGGRGCGCPPDIRSSSMVRGRPCPRSNRFFVRRHPKSSPQGGGRRCAGESSRSYACARTRGAHRSRARAGVEPSRFGQNAAIAASLRARRRARTRRAGEGAGANSTGALVAIMPPRTRRQLRYGIRGAVGQTFVDVCFGWKADTSANCDRHQLAAFWDCLPRSGPNSKRPEPLLDHVFYLPWEPTNAFMTLP
jgi:hypothetical protein